MWTSTGVGDGGAPAYRPLADGTVATVSVPRKQQRLLDIRRQQRQVHDLRDAGSVDGSEASQFGVVGRFAPVHEFLHVDGEGHEA